MQRRCKGFEIACHEPARKYDYAVRHPWLPIDPDLPAFN
jgi:hypothetical protein